MARTYRARKRFYRRKYKNMTTAKKASKALAIAKSLVRAKEKKEIPMSFGPTSINWNGQLYPLTDNVPQGASGETERIGDEIKLNTLTLRGRVSMASTSVAVGNTFRMIIFRGKHEAGNGYTISTGDATRVLDQGGYQGAPFAMKDEGNKYNTKFLYDKTITLDAAKQKVYAFEIVLKLNSFCRYNGNTGPVHDGGIYMIVVSDTNTGTDIPTWFAYGQISYTDA